MAWTAGTRGDTGASHRLAEQRGEAVLESPTVASKLAAQGFTPKPMTPESFRKFIQDETVKFADLIKTNNITVD